jgi:murein DD-endopeptidase MepM/ murein hydrolase activator NlpD
VVVALTAVVSVSALREVRDGDREMSWLRARLVERRAVVERQREELRQVAEALARLRRTAGTVGERAAGARSVTRLDTSPGARESARVVTASLDGDLLATGPDGAQALRTIAWLEGQMAMAGESLAVLAALFEERRSTAGGSMPSVWPVRGAVTSEFGVRRSPYGDDVEHHSGIDLRAPYGTPVVAPGGGEVVFAGRDPGYGSLVIIDHGNAVRSLFGHLSAIYVRQGQRVRPGDAIGAVGRSGRATGVHLHYEVRHGGVPIDPRLHLGGAEPVATAAAGGGAPLILPAAIHVPRRSVRAALVRP